MSESSVIDGDIIPPELLSGPVEFVQLLRDLLAGQNPLSGKVWTEYPLRFRVMLPYARDEKSGQKCYMRLKLQVVKDPEHGNLVIRISGVK